MPTPKPVKPAEAPEAVEQPTELQIVVDCRAAAAGLTPSGKRAVLLHALRSQPDFQSKEFIALYELATELKVEIS